jgi:hypothetical protein
MRTLSSSSHLSRYLKKVSWVETCTVFKCLQWRDEETRTTAAGTWIKRINSPARHSAIQYYDTVENSTSISDQTVLSFKLFDNSVTTADKLRKFTYKWNSILLLRFYTSIDQDLKQERDVFKMSRGTGSLVRLRLLGGPPRLPPQAECWGTRKYLTFPLVGQRGSVPYKFLLQMGWKMLKNNTTMTVIAVVAGNSRTDFTELAWLPNLFANRTPFHHTPSQIPNHNSMWQDIPACFYSYLILLHYLIGPCMQLLYIYVGM